mgnify:CR=1 FL=1|tara:strand:+ start:2026 stop:3792 length:1767 start_codon:yes stop_codon:yes gene_type:complete
MAIDPSKYQIYAEKDLNRAQIDWGTVAGTLAAGLDSIRTEREARRQKIQDDTVDAMNKLNEVPDVNNQSLSQMIINASNDQKDLLQTRLDLVKRGISNPKDYKLLMNNMQNGYKSLSTIVKNYDKYYTSKMEAIESGTQSELDAFVAETVEQFGNLEGKTLWTNPVNGQLQLVTMIPDPENPGQYIMPDPNKNPEKFQNPNNVNTIMRFNEKRKVLQDEAKKVTDTIASYIRSSVANGVVTKVKDFRNQLIGGKTYDEWMKSQIGFLTSSDNDIAQILTNSGEYTFTSSEADKGPNKIFVNNSSGKPVLELPPGAKERAEQLAREAIDSQIDSEITKTPGFDQNRSSATTERDRMNKSKETVESLVKLYEGKDEQSIDSALAQLMSQSGLIYESFEEDDDNNLIISYRDNNGEMKSETIPRGNNVDDFIKNAYRFILGDDGIELNRVLPQVNYDKNVKYNENLRRNYRKETGANNKDLSLRYVDDVITSDVIALREGLVQKRLQADLGPFGFTISVPFSPGSDRVTIKAPDGTSVPFILSKEGVRESMINFINGKITKEAADNQQEFLRKRYANDKGEDDNSSDSNMG